MIISNATPLIAFSRIGRLDLLRVTAAEPLVIPAAVASEISDYERGGPGSIDLAQETRIQTQAVEDEQQVRLLLPTLDRGEAEVIALGLEQQARLVLIDELIGRKVAESLGLRLTGSVGILIRAKQLGEITTIKPLLEHMVREACTSAKDFWMQCSIRLESEASFTPLRVCEGKRARAHCTAVMAPLRRSTRPMANQPRAVELGRVSCRPRATVWR